jgi:hypothetical protein
MRSELRQPPLNTRFKTGQSGNPRGRPVNNTAALLAAALNEMARGRPSPRTGSAGRSPERKAVIAQLVNESASADLRATNVDRYAAGHRKKGGAGRDREKTIRSDRQIGGPITPLG